MKDIGEIVDIAIDHDEKLREVTMDYKESRDWGVYQTLRAHIMSVKDTMPLVRLLRGDAMRERHWKELRFEVKEDFDENGEDFNIERVFSLGLYPTHDAKINEMYY
jgi:dynein heavy chain